MDRTQKPEHCSGVVGYSVKPAGICRIKMFLGVQFGKLNLRWALEPCSVISPHWATATVESVNLSELLQKARRGKTELFPQLQHIKDSTVLHVDLSNCQTAALR